ncbi:MAG: TatD family nuclease-associated radical SAM protein [Bacillota bacterium]
MSNNMTIAYTIGSRMYLNITNCCQNDCQFCIRRAGGIGYNLWLEKEPTVEEILDAARDAKRYQEVVFCGYGEPLLRLETVTEVAREIHRLGVPIRVNTNGQVLLYYDTAAVDELLGSLSVVSVSLNAQDAETYVRICRPQSGAKAYASILQFARYCLSRGKRVILTAVEWPGVDLEACSRIAGELRAAFRIRRFQGSINTRVKNWPYPS